MLILNQQQKEEEKTESVLRKMNRKKLGNGSFID
jgi:hypothetical protein